MKKIVITEEQSKKLIDKIVNEQVPAVRQDEYSIDDGRYRMKCEFRFDYGYNNLTPYKGGEIDDITDALAEVTFAIDIQHETYGISKMDIIDIKGPQSIKTTIRYYPEGSSSEDEGWWKKRIEEPIVIPLDWRKMEIDDSGYKMNYVGVRKRIDVDVVPDGKGGLVSKNIQVEVKNLQLNED
jgi:hypothetical protein